MAQDFDATMVPPTPETPNKKNTILIVAIVLVVLCCCCLGVLGLAWAFGDQIVQTLSAGF